MSERLHPKNTQEAQDQLNRQLHILSEIYGPLRYSIVGGAALKALYGQPLHPYRKNGRAVDVDGIAFDPDTKMMKFAATAIEDEKVKDPAFPEIGIEQAVVSDLPTVHHSLLSMLMGMQVSSYGKVYMTFRKLKKEAPQATLETRLLEINRSKFSVFPAKTIWLRLYQLFWNVDKFTGGRISGAKGTLYKMILVFSVILIELGVTKASDLIYQGRSLFWALQFFLLERLYWL